MTTRSIKPKRARTLRREVYNSPGLRIKDSHKPATTHQTEGFVVDEAFILAAGCVSHDNGEREYHDIRIYFKAV